MRKRVLIVEQRDSYRREVADIVRRLRTDLCLMETQDVASAYQYAAEYAVDVFIIGVLPQHRMDVPEYKFIASLRRMHRYMFAPVILISNIEDETGYVFRTLHCYECIETPYNPAYLQQVIEQAVCHTTERPSDASIYLRKNRVVYPVSCSRIVYTKASERTMRICMQDADVYEIPYLTIRQLLEEADYPYLLQCARNTIINMTKVREIDITNRYVTVVTGDTLDIGLAYVKKIKERMAAKL